jgi:hypothetical protein
MSDSSIDSDSAIELDSPSTSTAIGRMSHTICESVDKLAFVIQNMDVPDSKQEVDSVNNTLGTISDSMHNISRTLVNIEEYLLVIAEAAIRAYPKPEEPLWISPKRRKLAEASTSESSASTTKSS